MSTSFRSKIRELNKVLEDTAVLLKNKQYEEVSKILDKNICELCTISKLGGKREWDDLLCPKNMIDSNVIRLSLGFILNKLICEVNINPIYEKIIALLNVYDSWKNTVLSNAKFTISIEQYDRALTITLWKSSQLLSKKKNITQNTLDQILDLRNIVVKIMESYIETEYDSYFNYLYKTAIFYQDYLKSEEKAVNFYNNSLINNPKIIKMLKELKSSYSKNYMDCLIHYSRVLLSSNEKSEFDPFKIGLLYLKENVIPNEKDSVKISHFRNNFTIILILKCNLMFKLKPGKKVLEKIYQKIEEYQKNFDLSDYDSKSLANLCITIGFSLKNGISAKTYPKELTPYTVRFLEKASHLLEFYLERNDDLKMREKLVQVKITISKLDNITSANNNVLDHIEKAIFHTNEFDKLDNLIKKYVSYKFQQQVSDELCERTLWNILKNSDIDDNKLNFILDKELSLYMKYNMTHFQKPLLNQMITEIYVNNPYYLSRALGFDALTNRDNGDLDLAIERLHEALNILKPFVNVDFLSSKNVETLSTLMSWLGILIVEKFESIDDESSPSINNAMDLILEILNQCNKTSYVKEYCVENKKQWVPIIASLSILRQYIEKMEIFDNANKDIILERNRSNWRNPEDTCELMYICSELLNLYGEYKPYISCLETIILFHERVLCNENSERECMNCYTLIGNAYHIMGLTEPYAINYFQKYLKQREIDDDKPPDSNQIIQFLSASKFLLQSGKLDIESGIEIVLNLCESLMDEIAKEKPWNTARNYDLLASCRAILSLFKFEKGDIDDALIESLMALKLRRCSIPKEYKRGLTEKVAPVGNMFHISDKLKSLKGYYDSLEQTSLLYMMQGSVREAEFYLLKGTELADALGNKKMKCKMLLHLYKLKARSQNWDGTEKDLAEIETMINDNDLYYKTLESAKIRIDIGDLYRKCIKDLEQSIESYEEADNILSSLYQSTDNDIQVTTRITRRSKSSSKSSESPSNHIPIKNTRVRVKMKKGIIQFLKGIEEEDQTYLENASSIFTQCLTELNNIPDSSSIKMDKAVIEYYLGQTHISKYELERLESGDIDPYHNLWCFNKSLPRSMTSTLTRAKKNLKNALKYSVESGTVPRLTADISQLLALISGIKKVEDSAYYMNRSIGLTARHQMIETLIEQIRKNNDKDVLYSNDDVAMLTQSLKSLSLEESGDKSFVDKVKNLVDLYNMYSFENDIKDIENIEDIVNIFGISEVSMKWTTISICLSPDYKYLLISRLQYNKKPAVFRLPLMFGNKSDSLDDINENYYLKLESEFLELESKIKEILSMTEEQRAKANKKEHWNKRMQMEKSLKKIVCDIENNILGCWKVALLGSHKDDDIESQLFSLAKSLKKEMETSLKRKKISIDETYLYVLLNGLDSLDEINIKLYIEYLLGAEDHVLIEQVFDMIMERYNEISAHLKKNQERNHIILILDRKLHKFPWESCPILENLSVSRMPSLSFVRARILQYLKEDSPPNTLRDGINPKKTFYVLNPDKDLQDTERNFANIFRKNKWNGFIGSAPTTEEFEELFSNNHVYLYCGHNSGEQYIRRSQIRKTFSNVGGCVAFLMGCSSAKIDESYDPSGLAYSYLISGSPALFGTLWMVTTKDIDRVTHEIIKWLTENGEGMLTERIPEFRKSCNLRYLNGAAMVCYGLPVKILNE